MKIYYPKDKNGNQIGFRTPESYVFDKTGTSLTDKLAELNSNILIRAKQQDLDAEKARIDKFTSLSEGSTTGDAELQDIRVGYDGKTYNTAGNAVRGQIKNTNEKIDTLITHGFNLFNKELIETGFLLNKDESKYQTKDGFVSNYIAVTCGETYRLNVIIGSETYPSILYYDETKKIIGYYIGSNLLFTIPEKCSYVKINGNINNLNSIYFSKAFISQYTDYSNILKGSIFMKPFLWSSAKIYYKNHEITSAENMFISSSDFMLFNIGKTAEVIGSGAFLFWNKEQNTFIASDENIADDNIYFISLLKYMEFGDHIPYISLLCSNNCFVFDFINDVLHINMLSDAYLFNDGDVITIKSGYSQDLSISINCFIIYDIEAENFASILYVEYLRNKSKYIPICSRFNTTIVGNVGYETVINDLTNKRMVCYGDSLTWYDGNKFTWGEHEGEECIGYERYIEKYLGIKVYNQGSSGQTTPEICSRLINDNLEKYDYILLMGGDNDDRLNIDIGSLLPLGSNYDTTTVYGTLQYSIEKLLQKYPYKRIILMTEPMGWTKRNGNMERVDEKYPTAYRDISKLYGIPLIDNWRNSGINEFTRDTLYCDPVASINDLYVYHPNNEGWKIISKYICNELKRYL